MASQRPATPSRPAAVYVPLSTIPSRSAAYCTAIVNHPNAPPPPLFLPISTARPETPVEKDIEFGKLQLKEAQLQLFDRVDDACMQLSSTVEQAKVAIPRLLSDAKLAVPKCVDGLLPSKEKEQQPRVFGTVRSSEPQANRKPEVPRPNYGQAAVGNILNRKPSPRRA